MLVLSLVLWRRCLLIWLALLILLRLGLLVRLRLLVLWGLSGLILLRLLVLLRRHGLVLLSLRRRSWRIRRVGRILLALLRQRGHAAQQYSQRQDADRPAIPLFACVAAGWFRRSLSTPQLFLWQLGNSTGGVVAGGTDITSQPALDAPYK